MLPFESLPVLCKRSFRKGEKGRGIGQYVQKVSSKGGHFKAANSQPHPPFVPSPWSPASTIPNSCLVLNHLFTQSLLLSSSWQPLVPGDPVSPQTLQLLRDFLGETRHAERCWVLTAFNLSEAQFKLDSPGFIQGPPFRCSGDLDPEIAPALLGGACQIFNILSASRALIHSLKGWLPTCLFFAAEGVLTTSVQGA